MAGIRISGDGRIEIQTNSRYIDSDDPDNVLTRGILGKRTAREQTSLRNALKQKLKGRKKRDLDEYGGEL